MGSSLNRKITYTEQYFLSKYKKHNLTTAIKSAVKSVMSQAKNNDVYGIAELLKIKIVRTLDISGYGLLCTNRNLNGYIVYLKDQLPEFEEKYTIAHEIGHTLFFQNMRHQIGILCKNELSKEEYICNKFAALLLRELNI